MYKMPTINYHTEFITYNNKSFSTRQNKSDTEITYLAITLYDDIDKHNYKQKDILHYGYEYNVIIKQHYIPDNNETIFGYAIFDSNPDINNIIINKIHININNRLLFS